MQLKYIYFLQNRKLHCNKQLRYQCFQYESNPPVYFFYNIIPIKPQSRLNFYTTPVSDVAHHSYYTPFSSKSFTTSPPPLSLSPQTHPYLGKLNVDTPTKRGEGVQAMM